MADKMWGDNRRILKEIAELEERVEALEEQDDLKSVTKALNRIAVALEKFLADNDAALQKRINEVTAKVLANQEKIHDAQEEKK